jgi:hypothetical protein
MGTSLDYAIVAYNPAGNQLWSARYDGPSGGHEYSTDIAIDSSGNVYVTGWSPGTTNTSPWAADYATIAYDSVGNQLWVARYNSQFSMNDYATSMALGSSGNVYVTGYSQGSNTQYDYATVAYDSNGNELWVRRYDSPTGSSAHSNAIAVDSSGNVYVTGWSPYPSALVDITTIAYDSNGTELWLARYDGPLNGVDKGNAIAVDSSGNIYVTGTSSDTPFTKDNDYVTVAYDSGGNELWATRYNGPEDLSDIPCAIAVDPSGNVYVTGKSYGTYGGVTEYDYATVAYSSAGNELWVRRYNGPGNIRDEANDIAIDLAGNVYVTGHTQKLGTSSDYATIAYNSNGTQLWEKIYDGQLNNYDEANAITVDSSGNVYVTGRSYVGIGPEDQDFVTIKYYQFPTGPVEVDIDIKPGENPNSINLGSQGNVPVAIFSTADFDATTVDPTTVTLAGASVRLKGKGTPMASFEDINGDGLLDIIVHVDTTALELTGEDTEAILEGETFDGQKIRGVDTIRIVQE